MAPFLPHENSANGAKFSIVIYNETEVSSLTAAILSKKFAQPINFLLAMKEVIFVVLKTQGKNWVTFSTGWAGTQI